MRPVAEQSAAAAVDAASQARETNRLAEMASILENRPWVEIRDFTIDLLLILEWPHPAINTRYGMSVSGRYRIKNLGKTPAVNVYSAQALAVRHDVHRKMENYIEDAFRRLEKKEGLFFQGILGPGVEDVVTFSWLFPVAEPPVIGAGYVQNELEIAIAPIVAYESNLAEGKLQTAQAFALKLDAEPGMHRFDPDFAAIREKGKPENLVAVRTARSRMT
ncbi:hypothetical protein GOL41_26335 [Sinorhizobium medicae]|nr:hypothetical protein [Sinorhizobium medicae]